MSLKAPETGSAGLDHPHMRLCSGLPRVRGLGTRERPDGGHRRSSPSITRACPSPRRSFEFDARNVQAGSLQEAAMTVEDAAVLAKLFSHLRSPDQISVFLWAFQDLRQPRCASVLQKEFGDIRFMSLPPGEFQQMRDDTMRAKRDAGLGALEATDDLGESPEWEQIKEVFAYDAEDEADNWWHKWGLLRERAQGKDIACGLERIQVAHEVSFVYGVWRLVADVGECRQKAQLFEGPTVRSISLVQGGLL